MANRFWVGQSGGGNYNSTDWALTTGGTTGQATPTSSDAVTFDGAGTFGNTACTITATANALTLTFTSGYTSTITINATFTIVVAGNFTDNTAHTWVNNSVSSQTLTINTTSTITSGGKTFPGNVTFSGATTKTLVGDWTIGLLTVSATTVLNKTTAEILTVTQGLAMNAAMSGSGNITITGGTWSGTTGLSITGTFNFAGTVTVSGSVAYSAGTIKYTSGTITTTGSTLLIVVSTTFDTNGISWNNVTVQGTSQTYTLNSLLTVGATLLLNGVTTSIFAGTAGFTCATLSHILVAAYAVTLKNSITYTVTTSFSASATRAGAILSFISDDGTLRANLILQNQSSICLVIASFTRIDASTGARPINPVVGTITDSPNVIIPPGSSIFYNPLFNYNRHTRRFNLTNSSRVFQYK